jgi:hypothetical protein
MYRISYPFFHCLSRTEGTVWLRGFCECFVKRLIFYGLDLLAPRPTPPPAGGPPLVGCSRLFIQYIRSYPPYPQAVPPAATWGRAMPWWSLNNIVETGRLSPGFVY